MPRELSIPEVLRSAWPEHKDTAIAAARIERTYWDLPFYRAPGMQCAERSAYKMHFRPDLTPDECASREYIYRWNLALKSHVFGVPHTLGM